MPKKKILVVDDQPCQLETMSIILENRGYEVLIAESSGKVKVLFQDHDFDLIITDFVMKDGDNGINVLDLCRAKNPDTPVLVRSGDETFTSSDDWRQLGFDAVSLKTEETKKLSDKISLLLQVQGKIRALVIDTNETMRELLVKILTRNGFGVCTASAASEALGIINQVKFQLVTTAGLLENGTTGEELARNPLLKKAKSRVVLISSYVKNLEIPADGEPFFARIPKPFQLAMINKLTELVKNTS